MYAAAAQVPSGTKSPEAFRTISEVASELDVPQHVLRFWESRFVQVRPTKRAGGRRYYRPVDVDLLRGIRALLYSDGYTIKGVQKLLRERGPRYVADIGRSCIRPIDASIEALRQSQSYNPTARILPLERFVRPALADEERERLEILLAELVQLKARMRTATRRQ
jgi:DNA-binding transcriptional MerR regulator